MNSGAIVSSSAVLQTQPHKSPKPAPTPENVSYGSFNPLAEVTSTMVLHCATCMRRISSAVSGSSLVRGSPKSFTASYQNRVAPLNR